MLAEAACLLASLELVLHTQVHLLSDLVSVESEKQVHLGFLVVCRLVPELIRAYLAQQLLPKVLELLLVELSLLAGLNVGADGRLGYALGDDHLLHDESCNVILLHLQLKRLLLLHGASAEGCRLEACEGRRASCREHGRRRHIGAEAEGRPHCTRADSEGGRDRPELGSRRWHKRSCSYSEGWSRRGCRHWLEATTQIESPLRSRVLLLSHVRGRVDVPLRSALSCSEGPDS